MLLRHLVATIYFARTVCSLKNIESSAAHVAKPSYVQMMCCRMCLCDASWPTCHVSAASKVAEPSCDEETEPATRRFVILSLYAVASLQNAHCCCGVMLRGMRQKNAHSALSIVPWDVVALQASAFWTST